MSSPSTEMAIVLTFADDLFFRDDLAGFELRNKLVNGMLSNKIGNYEEFLSQVVSNGSFSMKVSKLKMSISEARCLPL